VSSVPRNACNEQEANASATTANPEHERHVAQCQQWNADVAHQAMTGKARAAHFTSASQSAAGHARFAAFSARWRARQGLAPLLAEDVRRYVTPAVICSPLGITLPLALQQTIWQAWCSGRLLSVDASLSDDPSPDPTGLWAQLQPEYQPVAEE
jgi:hypothetical protein